MRKRFLAIYLMACMIFGLLAPGSSASASGLAAARSKSVTDGDKALTQTIRTSDGSTYEVAVTYPADAGIPKEGTELLVSEIKPEDSSYDGYVEASMEELGAKNDRVLFARVFDISIADAKDHSLVYEPNGKVDVTIRLIGNDLSKCAKVDVLHFTEQKMRATKGAKAADSGRTSVSRMNAAVKEDEVAFSTDGFSVYVIIGHEGGEVVTPRVEFHFIAPTETAPVGQNYTASPYVFRNKQDFRQATMIVRDGDTLESIEAPQNTAEAYFYGWYTVTKSADSSSYDGASDQWSGEITYSWPENTKRIELDKAVSVSAERDGETGALTSVTWSVGGVSGTVAASDIDADGCAHVYLAPIYENYYFVNFHLGVYESSTATNIMARKLAIFGSGDTASVRVGDIEAPSTDPIHQIFVGWEYDANAGTGLEPDWQMIPTIDMTGNEIVTPGKDGTYMTVTPGDVDLYPVFVQARWINFGLGASGNGALYVGPQFMYTSDINDYPLEGRLPVPERSGYDFDGWYLDVDEEQNGTGIRIADATGAIVHGVNGAEYIYPEGSSVEEGTAWFRISADGEFYVYGALNELTVHAKWKSKTEDVTYKVIIWKQKVTDDPNAADGDKTYDYYSHDVRDFVFDGSNYTVNVSQSDLNYETTNPGGSFTGFHLGRYDQNVTIDPQGSTVLNVYYDRDKYTFTFMNYIYTPGTGTDATYGLLNGIYVRLSRSGNTYYYLRTQNNSNGNPVGADATVYNYNGNSTTTPSYNNTYYSGTGGSGRLYWGTYSGTRYTRSASRQPVKTIVALSGQDISSQFPIVGDDGFAYNHGERWNPQNSTVYSDVIVVINKIPNENITFNLDYAVRDTRTINYYVQMLPGGTPDKTVNGTDYVLYGNPVNANVNFFTQEDFVEIEGFTQNGSNPAFSNGRITDMSVDFYYLRKQYDLSFAANYPQTLVAEEPDPVVIEEIYFGASLAGYAGQEAPELPSSDYFFDGWYEDASCTIPFNFADGTMPAANKIIYAKWSFVEYMIHIDPNGGVIDHIDYGDASAAGLAATGLANAGTGSHDISKATYFDNIATQTITRYENVTRPYVEISDAEAAQMAENTVYRYVYTYFSGLEGGKGKLGSDARNAVYILDNEASLAAFYDFYVAQVELRKSRDPELVALPRAQWESTYVSREKYRKVREGEHYVFLGWYEIDENDERAAMPFDFSQPATHETMLRAYWRLDGGYSLQYTTEYYAENGDYITGNLENWIDPYDGGAAYTDGATTMAMQEPTAIMVNATPNDTYQFRGWQIVKVETVAGRPRYTPLEPGVYYTAGQPLTVQAKYSDENMIIHMQAIYELRADAYRRPDVVNLTLLASPDGTTDELGHAAPAGTSHVDLSKGALPTWMYPGHFFADTAGIYFGDVQSNTAVHLYKYATTLTASEISGEELTPAGVNFFEHSQGYFLVGFDLDQPDNDFIPDYPADAVIAVAPGEAHTLHTVWEPMVYMTFVNDTGIGDLTVNLTGTGRSMYIINQAKGSYERTLLDPSEPIVIPKDGRIRIVVPYGENERITVTGTNSLGTGYLLSAKSELGLTNPVARTLKGELTDTAADYQKVLNGGDFSFSDSLVTNAEGVVITFTAEKSPHTLILQDNHNGDGTGGSTKEISFSEKASDGTVYYVTEDATSYTLPSTSTRLGYEFLGWDPDFAATEPMYSEAQGWTITNLKTFFDNGSAEIKTLYGIWRANAEASTVYVWKEIQGPGDPNAEFTFTVAFSGGFSYSQYGGMISGWNNQSGTIAANNANGTAVLSSQISIKNGEHLKIFTEQYVDDSTSVRPYLRVTIEKYDADNVLVGTTNLQWQWQYYNHDSTNNQYRRRSFRFTNLNISVTEADYSDLYEQTETIAAETTTYSLKKDEPGRKIYWTDTFTGGTVIFTNTRKTADVTITKTLLPANLAATSFLVDVAFANGTDATHFEGFELTTASRRIVSGTEGWTIEDIPTGAQLVITETVDSTMYETVAAATVDSGGTSIADLDTSNDNIFKFTLLEDSSVNFTNTMKKQKVRLVVVDDDSPANYLDSANFTWPGVFDGTKFSAAGTGLVFEGEVYVGNYTLTETEMPEHSGVRYIKLQSPVTVAIGGTEVTVPAGTENVSVSGPDANGYYTVTVVNPKLLRMTVKKAIVNDYGSNSFLFTATLTDQDGNPIQMTDVYGSNGTNANGQLEFTLVNNQAATLYVPRNANLTIAETPDDWYETVYQTGEDANTLGAAVEGTSVAFTGITDDRYALFTNTRKMIEVIVKKKVVGPGGTFTFAATVKNNGSVMTIYTDNGFTAGEQTFTLSPANNGTDELTLIVPAGAMLVIRETDLPEAPRYNTTATGEATDDTTVGTYDGDNLSITLTADQTIQNLTVTFTNSEVLVAPTGVKSSRTPYLWMLLLGAVMLSAMLYFCIFRRRRYEYRDR